MIPDSVNYNNKLYLLWRNASARKQTDGVGLDQFHLWGRWDSSNTFLHSINLWQRYRDDEVGELERKAVGKKKDVGQTTRRILPFWFIHFYVESASLLVLSRRALRPPLLLLLRQMVDGWHGSSFATTQHPRVVPPRRANIPKYAKHSLKCNSHFLCIHFWFGNPCQ